MAKSKNTILMRFYIGILCYCFFVLSYAQHPDFKSINFEKADRVAKAHQGASLRHLPLLAYRLTKDLDTQVEQFRAIHTWVCLNIKSDYYLSERVLKKLKKFKTNNRKQHVWNSNLHPYFFKHLIEDKTTICTGYAYLIKALSVSAGIPCKIVNGYSKTPYKPVNIPSHSWNVVQLNGKWYPLDATWASGYYDTNKDAFVKAYNDGYFLAVPELFIKNHYPLEQRWQLLNDTISLDTFKKGPLVYNTAFKTHTLPISPKQFVTTVKTGDSISFKFKTPLKNNLSLEINKGLKVKTIKANRSHLNKGIVSVNHVFTTKGMYTIHAKINHTTIASYSVKCTKGTL
jgi:hypothetical protein